MQSFDSCDSCERPNNYLPSMSYYKLLTNCVCGKDFYGLIWSISMCYPCKVPPIATNDFKLGETFLLILHL